MNRHDANPTISKKPGKKARNWVKFHTQWAAPTTYRTDFVWDRTKWASGPWLTDVDGNTILDFISHVGSSPLGYNHPKIMELIRSMTWTDPDRYAGCDFITAYGDEPNANYPTPSHLHHKIREITKQFGFDQAFFTNSGAEAVENAVKICYSHHGKNGYGVSFQNAFHGRTLGVLSLNRSKAVQRESYPQLAKITPYPYCNDWKNKCKPGHCGWRIIGKDGKQTNALSQDLDKQMGVINPEEVAYIILEPVQGEGGYNFPSKDFIKDIFTVAREHNIPVIADEVQSGMGKTGKWWAIENYKQKPDVLATAKSLRVGATISSKKIFPQENGRISSTWGEGNAMASAVACKTIETIQKQNLLSNATNQGRHLKKRLNELERKFTFLSDARGLGLMAAIDVDTQKRRNAITKEALTQGLLCEGAGFKAIRFLPPLNVNKREIDVAMDALTRACSKSR